MTCLSIILFLSLLRDNPRILPQHVVCLCPDIGHPLLFSVAFCTCEQRYPEHSRHSDYSSLGASSSDSYGVCRRLPMARNVVAALSPLRVPRNAIDPMGFDLFMPTNGGNYCESLGCLINTFNAPCRKHDLCKDISPVSYPRNHHRDNRSSVSLPR